MKYRTKNRKSRMGLRDKIFEKARKSNLVRRIYVSIFSSYEREWDLLGRNEDKAIKHILNVEDRDTFDLRGEQYANELKRIVEPNSVVLNFGCGIGRVEKFLGPHCKEIHGVDVSEKMLTLAKKNVVYENVHFHKNNGRDLSMFSDKKFDFAFSIAVLQHIEKEDAIFYLMEIYRVLKENGKAYLQFPNLLCDYNLRNFLDASKQKYRGVSRMRYYTPIEIEKILQAIGFKIDSLVERSDYEDQNGKYNDYSIYVLVSKIT